MSFYAKETSEELEAHYTTIRRRYEQLMLRYTSRQFVDPVAREYAQHGYARRLKMLVRCIARVFYILPPDRSELPTADELSDCTINIQAFVFNAFGSLDNLAWVWVQERGLNKNGKPLGKRDIGLRQHNITVRESFSKEFRLYLDGLEPWFKGMGDFRDALAHRIPLYIPPYFLTRADVNLYNDLELRMHDALRRSDLDCYEALETEQAKLGKFNPVMTHSHSEKVGIVKFHPQLLADFGAVEELGRKMLEELDAAPQS